MKVYFSVFLVVISAYASAAYANIGRDVKARATCDVFNSDHTDHVKVGDFGLEFRGDESEAAGAFAWDTKTLKLNDLMSISTGLSYVSARRGQFSAHAQLTIKFGERQTVVETFVPARSLPLSIEFAVSDTDVDSNVPWEKNLSRITIKCKRTKL